MAYIPLKYSPAAIHVHMPSARPRSRNSTLVLQNPSHEQTNTHTHTFTGSSQLKTTEKTTSTSVFTLSRHNGSTVMRLGQQSRYSSEQSPSRAYVARAVQCHHPTAATWNFQLSVAKDKFTASKSSLSSFTFRRVKRRYNVAGEIFVPAVAGVTNLINPQVPKAKLLAEPEISI